MTTCDQDLELETARSFAIALLGGLLGFASLFVVAGALLRW
jgi:hypothetical protein